MIEVLIVDDHALVRLGLRELVSLEPDIRIAGEACDAREALKLIRERKWDVVVMDIFMPGQSGLELLPEIKRERPHLPVLVLSMHPEEHYAFHMFKLGASGYLVKNSSPQELVAAIRKVNSGGQYVSPAMAERLARNLRRDADRVPHELLSAREFEVLRLLASGKTVTEIAELLSVSRKTITSYRARLLEKMNMRSNAELTQYALRHGLI